MPKKKIRQVWKEMALSNKVGFIGAAVCILSLFLPWYSDIDSYKTGDVYIGISGPMYVAGFTILGLASLSLVILVYRALEKNKFGGKFVRSYFVNGFHLFAGIGVFYLLLLVNSAYFHPKFGLNVSLKEAGVGCVVALIGAGLLSFGGFIIAKENGVFKGVGSGEGVGENGNKISEVEVVEEIVKLRKAVAGLAKERVSVENGQIKKENIAGVRRIAEDKEILHEVGEKTYEVLKKKNERLNEDGSVNMKSDSGTFKKIDKGLGSQPWRMDL